MKVADLMTRRVRSVRPATPLKDVARLFTEQGIAGVPVVDGEDDVVGVISKADLLRILATHMHAATAREAMTTPAATIEPETPVDEVAQLMLERSVDRLPVVAAGELVGIISSSDLVRAFTRSDDEIAREIREEIARAAWLEPGRLSVEVDHGVVAVAGVVDTLGDAQWIERFVTRVPGVVRVRSTVAWRRDSLASRPTA